MKHLVVMAAGTGGHVIPGLAVAREMQSRGWSVSWLGTSHGMENQLVPRSGIPLDTISFSGLRGKGALHALTGGLRLMKAFWDCMSILRRRSANAVLGMGGYVCFPGGLMASWQSSLRSISSRGTAEGITRSARPGARVRSRAASAGSSRSR